MKRRMFSADMAQFLQSKTHSEKDKLWLIRFINKHWHATVNEGWRVRKAYLRERWQVYQSILRCAENAKVALVWSGMDCDCVKFSGKVRIHDADLDHVFEAIDDEFEHAEGMLDYRIMRPSEAMGVRYTSRDLALEAFEDGHPHVVFLGE